MHANTVSLLQWPLDRRRLLRTAAVAGGLAILAAGLSSGFNTAAAHAAPHSTDPGAGGYSFTQFRYPGEPGSTRLLGINNHGVTIGDHGKATDGLLLFPHSFIGLVGLRAFIDENGPVAHQMFVNGINNDRTIVGSYVDQQGEHGFLKPRYGDAITVDGPGGTTPAELRGINDNGVAVGWFLDAQGQRSYVRQADGSLLEVIVPMPISQATGINTRNTVVGFEQPSLGANTASGYVVKDGVLIELYYPGSTYTEALGVNNNDEVVGQYIDAQGATHGFLWRDGNFQPITYGNSTYTVVTGVNDSGRIVGFSQDDNGNFFGFLGDPLPAPQPVNPGY